MSVTDFLRLPPGVTVLFTVMLWPAIWAATGMIVALTGDFARRWRTSPATRTVR